MEKDKIYLRIVSIFASLTIIIFEIFLGIYITNYSEYKHGKDLEQIHLQSIIAEKKIEKTMELITMVQEPILTFQTHPADIVKQLPDYQGSNNSCSTILKSYDYWGEWTTNFHQFTSENRYLFSGDINLCISNIYLYNKNLDIILSNIDDKNVQQVGVVLHSEISQMFSGLSDLLQDYLKNDVYKLDSNDNQINAIVGELSPEYNLVKYKYKFIEILGEENNG